MNKKYGYISNDTITLTNHKVPKRICSHEFLEDVEFEVTGRRIEIYGSEIIFELNLHDDITEEDLERYDPMGIVEYRPWWKPWKKIRRTKFGWIKLKEKKPYHKILEGYKIVIDEN